MRAAAMQRMVLRKTEATGEERPRLRAAVRFPMV